MRALQLTTLVLALVVALVGVSSAEISDQMSDQALRKEQTQLEAGEDLSSRARRELFRARSRQDSGEFAAAKAIVEQWLNGDPARDHHLLRFNLGVSELALEQPAAALTQLSRAVELQPRFARAWLRRGEAAYELAQYRLAGESFSRAYDLSPDKQPQILYYAGVSLLTGGQPAPALDRLTRLVDTYPQQAGLEWIQALAAAAGEAKEAARAVPYLDRLLTRQPDDPAVWDLAYRFFAGQSDYEEAATLLTIGDYLQSLDRGALVNLGDLYSVIGIPLQAARYYERAFTGESEPSPQDYRKLATAWLAAHDLTAARAVLTTALAAAPTIELWELKGDLEYTAEDFAAARDAFGSAVALAPEFGRGYLMMGYCALELDRPAEARRDLTRALEFAEQKPSAAALLARLAEGD